MKISFQNRYAVKGFRDRSGRFDAGRLSAGGSMAAFFSKTRQRRSVRRAGVTVSLASVFLAASQMVYADDRDIAKELDLLKASLSGCNFVGGTCAGNTRQVWQITGGLWNKIHQGDFGYVRAGRIENEPN